MKPGAKLAECRRPGAWWSKARRPPALRASTSTITRSAKPSVRTIAGHLLPHPTTEITIADNHPLSYGHVYSPSRQKYRKEQTSSTQTISRYLHVQHRYWNNVQEPYRVTVYRLIAHHFVDLLILCGVAHLIVHETSGSTDSDTILPVPSATSLLVLLAPWTVTRRPSPAIRRQRR